MRNYIRVGTPMRRGGFGDVTVPSFSDVTTPEQLANIKNFYYQAGQDNPVETPADGMFSNLPSWALPAGIGLLLFVVLKGGRR